MGPGAPAMPAIPSEPGLPLTKQTNGYNFSLMLDKNGNSFYTHIKTIQLHWKYPLTVNAPRGNSLRLTKNKQIFKIKYKIK